jgi:sugar phosphate isomerase/epimerase
MRRRDFLKLGAISAAAVAASSMANPEEPPQKQAAAPLHERICLFTDHIDDFGYSYAEVASMIAPLAIAGLDATVRPGGLVAPERVAEELPKLAASLADAGMSIPMISTNLTSADDPTARPIFETMGRLGIRYYKLGYYHYHDITKWEAELASTRQELTRLARLGVEFGAKAGLHNHAGSLGGALWDAHELLRPIDPALAGYYFDPAHASIEGARLAWKLNLERAATRLAMVAIKDYEWEKTASVEWLTRWAPLCELIVNLIEFFVMFL